jgi:hypothetical protein
MRQAVIVTALVAALFTFALPGCAWAQVAKPPLSVDLSVLPPMPTVVSAEQRRQEALVATGAGASIAILLADLLTGGMLLAPLGIPSAASLFGAGAAAPAAVAVAAVPAAVPAAVDLVPTYTVSQQLLAGIGTFAAAVGGGYIGGYLAGTHADTAGSRR